MLLSLLFAAPAAFAEPASDGTNLSVSLLTFTPGAIYWERFGHNAILVRDSATGSALTYNYGVFDFNQENFFLNFARGRMRYRLGVFSLDDTLWYYQQEGRGVTEQRLNFTAAQRLALDTFLRWNGQPQNADYAYDYFRDNCSTRVRDALDRALGGALQKGLAGRPVPFTYRAETVRLLWPDRALAMAMDFAMGPAGDRPLDQWDAAFIPLDLMQSLRAVRLGDGQALVTGERQLLLDRLPPPPAEVPPLLASALVAGLVGAALLALLGVLRGNAFAGATLGVVGGAFLLVTGLAGLILGAMWLLTAHWGAWRDPMMLLANPLALPMLPLWWRAARLRPERSRLRRLAIVLPVMALAALPLAWFGIGAAQAYWIALLLPVHLAVAGVLLTNRPPVAQPQ